MTSLTALAKAKLKDLEKEIREAATILSQKEETITQLISEEETRRSRIVNLSEEERILIANIKKKTAEDNGLSIAYDEKRQQMITADESKEIARKNKEHHERRQSELVTQNALLEADKIDRNREISGLEKVKESLEIDVKRLTGEKVQAGNVLSDERAKIARMQTLYDRIKGSIERAIEQFRVFETRIGRLSEETGYMISWEDPKKLLEEE